MHIITFYLQNLLALSLGGIKQIDTLLEDEGLKAQKSAIEGLEELKLLLKYCELYGIADKVWILCIRINN